MGMFDTMNQAASPMGRMPNAMGQGFAQQQRPPTPSGNGTMQSVGSLNMQPKPMPAMQRPVGNMQKPNNNWNNLAQNVGNAASSFMQNRPGAGGSKDMIQQNMMQQKMQQQAAQGAPIGGSVGRPDMMRPQGGLANLQTPLDAQRQEQEPQYGEPVMGERGPIPGSQMLPNAREMQIMQDKMSASPDIQMGMGRTVNPYYQPEENGGGIGPSNPMQMMGQAAPPPPVEMDENGLEPRRGAR